MTPKPWTSRSEIGWSICCTNCCTEGAQEHPKTPQNAYTPPILHNNIRKTESFRNRQVTSSTLVVGSILSSAYRRSSLDPEFVVTWICDVGCSDRWLPEPNPTPGAVSAFQYAHPYGPWHSSPSGDWRLPRTPPRQRYDVPSPAPVAWADQRCCERL